MIEEISFLFSSKGPVFLPVHDEAEAATSYGHIRTLVPAILSLHGDTFELMDGVVSAVQRSVFTLWAPPQGLFSTLLMVHNPLFSPIHLFYSKLNWFHFINSRKQLNLLLINNKLLFGNEILSPRYIFLCWAFNAHSLNCKAQKNLTHKSAYCDNQVMLVQST